MLSAVAALGIVLLQATASASNGANHSGGFLTSTGAFVTVTDPATDWVRAIITSGDRLPSGFTWGKIPDGIGARDLSGDRMQVMVNHELSNGSNHGGFAKVSSLVLDTDDAGVLSAEYVIDGTEGYLRFCSSSSVSGHGFGSPTYFTNEEVDDGIVVAVDMRTGAYVEMPWLGLFSHENTVHVPYFHAESGLTVVISLEDGDATDSEVYMYVAANPNKLMDGEGQLYVLGAADAGSFAQWDDIYYATGWVDMTWVPLSWDWETQDEGDLDEEAVEAGAFRFIRPEDGASDKRSGRENVFYFADTGNNVDENGAAIPAGANGQAWDDGRMYELEFTDGDDPTVARLRVILDGNDPAAPGYGVMINPDNIDTSQNSLMIQEDRIGVNRPAVTSPYNMSLNAKVLRYDLASGDLEIVAYNNQGASTSARHGDWEASGILDVSEWFGEGAWLTTVQAHALSEGGQLLLLYVADS